MHIINENNNFLATISGNQFPYVTILLWAEQL